MPNEFVQLLPLLNNLSDELQLYLYLIVHATGIHIVNSCDSSTLLIWRICLWKLNGYLIALFFTLYNMQIAFAWTALSVHQSYPDQEIMLHLPEESD